MTSYLIKHYSGCFCEGSLLDEITLWISQLGVSRLLSIMWWASSNQLKAWIQNKVWPSMSKKEFCQLTTSGLRQQLFPEFSACQPTLQILDLPSLYNHMDQFCKVSLSLLSLLSEIQIFLLVLFLWRTLTNTPEIWSTHFTDEETASLRIGTQIRPLQCKLVTEIGTESVFSPDDFTYK